MTASSLDDAPAPIDHPALGRRANSERMPGAIRPMLATDAPEPFDSTEHIFELMWGGMRTITYVRNGIAQLRARNGIDLTPYFPELIAIPDSVGAHDAILDGEIIAVDAQGQPAFELLRPRLQAMADATNAKRGAFSDLPGKT